MPPMRERAHVEIDWGDRIGFIRRTLPVAASCPQCGAKAYRQLDGRNECTNEDHEPVECMRCVPLAWYARPRGHAARPIVPPPAARRSLLTRVRSLLREVLSLSDDDNLRPGAP